MNIYQGIEETATAPRASIEAVDVGLFGGFVALTVGLGMVWLPLALIVPGSLAFVISLWRIVR